VAAAIVGGPLVLLVLLVLFRPDAVARIVKTLFSMFG
jgi:hypothetical protein